MKKKRLFGILLCFALVLGLMPWMSMTTYAESRPQVKYLDASGKLQTCNEYREVTNENPILGEEGWYVVRGNVSCGSIYSEAGDIHLILCDGCTLSVGSDDSGMQIYNNLTVYAGSTGDDVSGTGALTIKGAYNAVSTGEEATMTINGGVVNLSSQGASAFDGTGTLVINGGSFTASVEDLKLELQSLNESTPAVNGSFTASGTVEKSAISKNVKVKVADGMRIKAGDSKETAVDVTLTFAKQHDQKWVNIEKKQQSKVMTAPKGKTLTHTGSAQELVTAGKATGGTMQYALGTNATTAPTTGWGPSIPTGTKVGTYYVWYKVKGDEDHIDSKPASVKAVINPAPKPEKKPEKKSEKKPQTKKPGGVLLMNMTAIKRNGLNFSWTRMNNVDGYDMFFSRCNHNGKILRVKKIKTFKGNSKNSWKMTGLKPGTCYKALVKAWVLHNGKKKYVKGSPMVHIFTSGGSGKYTNPRSVILKKSVTLKKNSSYQIRGRIVKLNKKKKRIGPAHEPSLRYMTSNSKVAAVSRTGKITAGSRGKCVIYVYTLNGAWRTMDVTVK